MKSWLKHAFAVDAPGPAEPTQAQQVPVDWLTRQVTKRHLTTPALIVLEMCRPLNWIFAQCMHFTEPMFSVMTPMAWSGNYKQFATFLEHRGSIEHICRRLEAMEAEFSNREAGRDSTAARPPSSDGASRHSDL